VRHTTPPPATTGCVVAAASLSRPPPLSLSLEHREGGRARRPRSPAADRGGNTFNGYKDFLTENGSSEEESSEGNFGTT